MDWFRLAQNISELEKQGFEGFPSEAIKQAKEKVFLGLHCSTTCRRTTPLGPNTLQPELGILEG